MKMTPGRIKEVQERCKIASAGPWVDTYYDERVSKTPYWAVDCNPPDVLGVAVATGGYGGNESQDANFIANARTDLPDALDDLEEAREALRDIQQAGLIAHATRIPTLPGSGGVSGWWLIERCRAALGEEEPK